MFRSLSDLHKLTSSGNILCFMYISLRLSRWISWSVNPQFTNYWTEDRAPFSCVFKALAAHRKRKKKKECETVQFVFGSHRVVNWSNVKPLSCSLGRTIFVTSAQLSWQKEVEKQDAGWLKRENRYVLLLTTVLDAERLSHDGKDSLLCLEN